jgi:DNA repair exonuclease SbcCD ATPase subunit
MENQQNQQVNNEQQNNGDPSDETKNMENMIPYERFKEVNDKYKQVQSQLDEFIKKQQEAEIENKKKQGEFQQLYETLNAEHEPLKKQFESYQQAFKEILKSRMEQVPEHMRDLVPSGNEIEQLRWIENAMQKGLFGKDTVQSFGNHGNNPVNNEKSNTGFLNNLGRKF